jgi:hypothetical protein
MVAIPIRADHNASTVPFREELEFRLHIFSFALQVMMVIVVISFNSVFLRIGLESRRAQRAQRRN